MELPYQALYRQLLLRTRKEEKIMSNKNMEPSDRILLIMLERMCPYIYSTLVPIQVWNLAEQAGCKPDTVGRFLTAMREKGYIDYKREVVVTKVSDDGKGDRRWQYTTVVSVQLLSACKEPETLNTKNTPRREKKREQDKARKRCTSCGGVVQTRKSMTCMSCGEVQP